MPVLSRVQRAAKSLPTGLLYIAGSALFFSWMSLLVKLAGERIPTMEVVFVRSVFLTASTYVLLRRQGLAAGGNDRRTLFWRGTIGVLPLSLFYFALPRIPLGDATALFYMSPIWTALIASVVLKERTVRLVFLGMGISLLGVVLIARPSFLFGGAIAEIDPVAVMAIVAASMLSGFVYVLVRKLRVSDAPYVIIFWHAWLAVVATLPFVAMGWVWPTPVEWAYLAGVGITTLVAQIFLTLGLHREAAGRAMSIGYLQVVFAFIWGVMVFGTIPDLWSLVGAAAIVGSVLLIARNR